MMRRLKFTPHLWPTLATLVAVPLLIALGQWQLGRAAEKQRGYAQFMQRGADPAIQLLAGDPEVWKLRVMQHRRIDVRGRYDGAVNFLLDNQVHEGVAGYFVYTPLRLEGQEAYLLVNRGWVAAGPDRRAPLSVEVPPGLMALSGVAALPPPPGIKLGENAPEQLAPNLIRLQRIELDQMADKYAGKLLPYELRLDPGSDGGFLRQWREPGSGHERNLGYAFQWFAMAVVVTLLYLFLNLRRDDSLK
ncbi:MAG: hypothetical protein A3H91_07290 [Gammaproteobacteria bacterium RIFCSPLOWO2_02_FULL_61_13]|nr:MAG: hypothetical protein A3H91_07290 [Gammaproteobacteria bacterium RIFCSPLOWO2_02_FULL_61_13]